VASSIPWRRWKMASVRVVDPVAVVQAPDLTITEFFGNVASGTPSLSACVAEVRRATEEAPQCPEFDELVLVLEGQVILEHAGGTTAVDAGQGAMLKAGTRVKWIWPGPCKYVPICTPAFTPENCGREDDGGHHAKTSESMDALRQLHYKARHPWLYHCALRSNWEAAKASGADYKPPTYAQDGFTHATADPALLIGVLNHFYRGSQGDWVCLRMSNKSLDAAGIPVKFEPVAPVGDTPALTADLSGGDLFPHLHGGIPASASRCPVLEEHPVIRKPDGTFVTIPGVTDAKPTLRATLLAGLESRLAAAMGGLAVGLVASVLLARRTR